MEKIILDVAMVRVGDTALLVKCSTNVFYTGKSDGCACGYPTCEGFFINIGEYLQDFNDCSYGCYQISENEDYKKRLAIDLEKYFKTHKIKTDDTNFDVSFDFERINELAEAWFPVIIKGIIDDVNSPKPIAIDWLGYINTFNCD